jgi:hypothetical protein
MTHIGYLKYLEAIGPSLDEGTKSLLSSVWDLAYAQGLREGVALERAKARPDILDALVEVMLRHVPFSNKEAYAEKARESIAKATGETYNQGKTK